MKLQLAACVAVLFCAGCVSPEASTRKVDVAANSGPANKQYIVAQAAKYNISRPVIEHVAKKESGFNCSPRNPRYQGPLQISQSSARALGYTGGGLNNCGAGLEYGLRHLALCVQKVGQDPRKAANCHAVPGKYGVRLAWNRD